MSEQKGHEKKGFCIKTTRSGESLWHLIDMLIEYKITNRTGWIEFHGRIFNTELPSIIPDDIFLEVYGMTRMMYRLYEGDLRVGRKIIDPGEIGFKNFIDAKNRGENVWLDYNDIIISSQDPSIRSVEDINERIFGTRTLEHTHFDHDVHYVQLANIMTALEKFFEMKAANKKYKISIDGQVFDTMDPEISSIEDVAKRFNMALEEFKVAVANEKIYQDKMEEIRKIQMQLYDEKYNKSPIGPIKAKGHSED